jgi:hypothetical protein
VFIASPPVEIRAGLIALNGMSSPTATTAVVLDGMLVRASAAPPQRGR